MTREEAIIRLKGLYGNGYTEQEQALDMAIEALQEKPMFIMKSDGSIEQIKKAVAEWEPRLASYPNSKVFDEIKAEIEMYEADCRLQGGTDECEKCNSNVFGSIYRIIDKYAGGEDKE